MVLLSTAAPAAAPATSPTDAAEWSDMLAEAKRTKEEADAKEAERQRQKEFEGAPRAQFAVSAII